LARPVVELEEEVIIIRIAISLASQGFDLVVDTFDFASGKRDRGMSNNPLIVVSEETSKPEKMTVVRGLASINDLINHIGHIRVASTSESFIKLFFHQISSEEQLVFFEKQIVPLLSSHLSGGAISFILLLQGGTLGSHDIKVLSDRSERCSTIVTTNLPFSRWTELFENTTMVSALVDRLTYRSHVLDMNGESYRLKATQEGC